MPKDSWQRYTLTIIILLLLILTTGYFSLTSGAFEMTVRNVVETLLRINEDPKYDLVIFDFRLPRILIAGLVGLGLGIAGAVIQGVTRNGLADSGILGINSGAGTAIVLFMFFFQGQIANSGFVSLMIMPIFGLCGGLLAAFLIFIFSWQNGRIDTGRLILTGIAISSGFGALSLYLSLKMNSSDFEMATVWLSGSIYDANWHYVLSIVPWLLILIPLLYRKAHLLDLFQLEESSIKSLGVSVEKEKVLLLLGSIGIVSACVAVSGSIAFVGLLSPHIARRLVGVHHRRVIPVCGGIGMLLVLLSDYIGKTIFQPLELPVGIVLSIIGVPYFLYLLSKAKA
ncbi:FecCD family ABC transporter permease [Priestia filamentosa]|uniref:Iron ABC transporter permease n=1 Tax=Priestia filamentosa TaxID=1402861 RepID=A0A1X7DBV5_9BACI|nr:iron ABC transporter permease [Priestia filamentosa]AKO93625.1 iron ABC transporter permease [Priestia filamentosa]MDT3763839.1 iron ABC transporter permease [Priestia filamentosa]OXS71678.1 iron ABC transporter permease [Priestia filamentosa]RJS67314.1 iron ABC transporter permease [Priestia filamentosa]WCM14487.1 iron ABC transporter permease [Priestia filamentosa]